MDKINSFYIKVPVYKYECVKIDVFLIRLASMPMPFPGVSKGCSWPSLAKD